MRTKSSAEIARAVMLVERRTFEPVLLHIRFLEPTARRRWVARLYRRLDRRGRILTRCEGRWLFAEVLIRNGFEQEFLGYIGNKKKQEDQRDWVTGLVRRAAKWGNLALLRRLHNWDLANTLLDAEFLCGVFDLSALPSIRTFVGTWCDEFRWPSVDEDAGEPEETD